MRTTFTTKLLVVCALAFIGDMVATWHILSLCERNVSAAIVSLIMVHYLGFFANAWFIDAKDTRKRFLLTTAQTLGATVGCFVTLMLGSK